MFQPCFVVISDPNNFFFNILFSVPSEYAVIVEKLLSDQVTVGSRVDIILRKVQSLMC